MSLWVRLPAPDELRAVGGRVAAWAWRFRPARGSGWTARWSGSSGVPYALPDEQLTEAVELLARAWRSITGAAGTGAVRRGRC